MKLKLAERLIAGILLVIAGGIVIHTPLTLWLGTLAPDWALVIKAWKEVLMGIALVLLVVVAARRDKLQLLLEDRLLQLSLVFAGLHLVMIMVFQNGLASAGAGLLIDLRFILYFVLVYAFLMLYPAYRRPFIITFAVGAVVALGFAVLQTFILPKDVLAHIGYSKATISPFLTVDENPAFIRINSTLRGPNPLGAYAVIVAGLLMAFGFQWKARTKRSWWVTGAMAAAAGVALGASYSRSSLLGAVLTMTAVTLIAVKPKIRRVIGVGIVGVAVVITIGLTIFRDSYFVSNVILHDNPSTGGHVDSNKGHADSLADGVTRMLRQPLGAGVGSTGSASLIGTEPVIIENQYLLVAHEVGWIGLTLFVWLFVEIMRHLWIRRKSALALGVFGSGAGLAFIGLLLPVWTDDTVSIVWWGLAAVAVAGAIKGKNHGKRKSD